MEKTLKILKERIIEYLIKQGNLDEPYIIGGSRSYTRNQIIYEIANDTKIGADFLSNIVILSLDLLSRGKEKTPEFSKE